MARKGNKQRKCMGSERKRRVLRALWNFYKGVCQRCQCKTGIASDLVKEGWTLAFDTLHKDKETLIIASVEHIVPRCNGGTHDRSNLTLFCVRCNADTNPRKRAPDPKPPVPSHVGSSIASICGLRDSVSVRPKGTGRKAVRKSPLNPDTVFGRMHRRKVPSVDTRLHQSKNRKLEGTPPLAQPDETASNG